MKIRTDVIRMYKAVHSWVGIIAGIALFVAFYAGAVTMFEEPIQRWASPPIALPKPVSLERTPELIEKLIAAHPGCVAGISITLAAAKLLDPGGTAGQHSAIYYTIFLAFTAYALLRGAARAGVELTGAAALAAMAIPIVSVIAGTQWYRNGASIAVDGSAIAAAIGLFWSMRSASRRIAKAPRDSIWASPNPA